MLELTKPSTCVLERREVNPASWAIATRFLIHGLVVSAWVSRIPAIQNALRLSNAQLGISLLGTALGSVIAVPLAGLLVRRLGSKPMTIWSTCSFCLALIGPPLATNGLTLFLALVLFGAMAGANDVCINSQGVALEATIAAPIMSRFHAMFSIGGMTGAGFGAFLAAHNVTPRSHLFAISALLLVFSFLTGPYLLDAKERAKSSRRGGTGRFPMVLFGLAVIGFCMFLSEGAIADWSAVYFKQVLGAGPGLAATAYASFSVGMATFRLTGDRLTLSIGAVATVRRGALLAAAALSTALLAFSPYWALPCLALTGAGFAAIVPLVFGAGGRVPSIPAGTGIAMVSGSGYIGFLFGPPLIGLLAQASSLRLALFFVVALSLIAAALAGAVGPKEELISVS